MKKRLRLILGYGALTIIALGVTVFLYWVYSPPQQAVSITPNPIPVTTPIVKPNEWVVLKYTYCKNVRANGRIVTTLIGQNIQLTLPVASERGDRKCETDVRIPVPVPALATPGQYHFHFRITYQVNPITSLVAEYDTANFMVE